MLRFRDQVWIIAGCALLGVFTAQVAYKTSRPKPVAPTPVVQIEDKIAAIELVTAPLKVTLTADEYLCEVYKRTPVKKDGAGDFTWKDPAAAKRLNMDVCTYSIGGMDPELKTRLVAFGKVADDRGLEWSMLSAFRDDYRQSIASGIKARTGNSLHGNSRATKGYGHGRAIDITSAGPLAPVLALFDKIGRDLGLSRPYKGFDPSHVQLASYEPPARNKVTRAKAKTRYAKHHKRTRIAVRNHDPDHSYRFDTGHIHRSGHSHKMPISRRA